MTVVDNLLARHGFVWKLYPYRIEDKTSGVVMTYGPHFNVTDAALVKMRESLNRKQNSRFR